ncbi:MAG: DUF3596 domain-containing protein [Bermanella sp.]
MAQIRQKQAQTYGEGVRVRGGRISIDFRWEGKRYREQTHGDPTQAGVKAATRLRAKIVNEISVGIFTAEKFVECFPNSKRAEQFSVDINESNDNIPTFADLAKEMLAIKEKQVQAESFKQLKGLLNKWWMPYLAGMKVNDIDEDLLENIDAELPWKTDKTRNNALTPLRQVFEKGMKKRVLIDNIKTPLLTNNPALCLENGKVSKPDPDPFTIEERDLLLTHFSKQSGTEIVWFHYFVIAFYTGMRTNELLGLEWEQIDFINKIIRVDRTMTDGKIRMQTKTGNDRDVPMLGIVERSLIAMKSFTFMQGAHVFTSPRFSQRALATSRAPNDAFQFVIKKLGIRQRRTYNTRHTFATVMLMDNVKPGYAAKVLGHSLMVFFSTYAKWLEGDTSKVEMAKIQVNDVFNESKSTPWSQIGHKRV